jgi:hypothetical protein
MGCCGRSRGGGSRLAKNLEHYSAAGGAFAFNGLAAILHGFFDAIGDGLFGLALDAVSFRHKKFAAEASCLERSGQATRKGWQRQFQTEIPQIQRLLN